MKQVRQGRSVRLLAHLYAMQKASREMSGGILHYAAVHPDVDVQLYGEGTPRSRLADFRAWHPDGLIVGTGGRATVRAAVALGCRAAVFVNAVPPDVGVALRHASIYCDNHAVAETAAKLFAKKRIGNFAFVGAIAGDEWSRERAQSFHNAAKAAGGTCAVFESPSDAKSDQRRELAALGEFLRSLPKPCGVFAANDARAKDVLDAARESGIAIPEQIMVLGVDDEEFICRQTIPTLSSIVPDFERGGYLAAEMLVKLVRGRKSQLPNRTFGVKGVVERTSTSDPNGAGRMVSRAREFIRDYATTQLSVTNVARASGASLRLLQKNFKAITGKTIVEAIQSERLEHVCRLLRETSTPISQVGELCGFESENYLKKLFRSRFGCTMREWRRH